MATFIVLRHPVSILVTAFTNLDNLTNNNKNIDVLKDQAITVGHSQYVL